MNPELNAGPFLLRPYRAEDIDPLYDAIRESLPELSRWFWWAHERYAKEETVNFIESRKAAWEASGECAFGVFDLKSGEFLGGVGINQIDPMHRNCNLGYWVRTVRTGRGVASIAARRVAEYALTERGLVRVEIVAAVGNRASQRVAEKIGAVREGVARKGLIVQDRAEDAFVYSLVAEDLL